MLRGCRDGLKCELKLVKEDCHRITLELKDRGLKAEKLAAKFETLVSKNRATDAEGGEPKSQAYYIIKVCGHQALLVLKQTASWHVLPSWYHSCDTASWVNSFTRCRFELLQAPPSRRSLRT